jgi:hypothetical protein
LELAGPAANTASGTIYENLGAWKREIQSAMCWKEPLTIPTLAESSDQRLAAVKFRSGSETVVNDL